MTLTFNLGGASNVTGATIQAGRDSRTQAYLRGPMVPAPAWVASTAYAFNNVVTLPNGQHLVASIAGTSAATLPVYSASALSARPYVDGSVTWYALPMLKSVADLNAPTVTTGASAAAVGLTESLFNVGGVIVAGPTAMEGAQVNLSNAYIGQFAFANAVSPGTGDATTAGTTAGYTATNAYQTNQWATEFYVTDSAFGITIHGSSTPVIVFIDGQLVQGNPASSSGVTGWCLKFDFNGVVKRRLIRITDQQTGANLRGVALSPLGYMDPSDSPNDKILLLGDSIAMTISNPAGYGLVAHVGSYLQKLLGITGLINCGVGGTGYVAVTVANTLSIPQVMSNAANQTLFASYAPNHVLFTGGINDSYTGLTAMQTAAISAWQSARTLFPFAKITVTDGFSAATGPSAQVLARSAAILSAYNTWNDPNSRFVASVGVSVQTAYLRGTATCNNAIAVGNTSAYVGTDGTHPSPIGAYYLADRLAQGIKAAWGDVGY